MNAAQTNFSSGILFAKYCAKDNGIAPNFVFLGPEKWQQYQQEFPGAVSAPLFGMTVRRGAEPGVVISATP